MRSLLAAVILLSPAAAQSVLSTKSGMITYVEGKVLLNNKIIQVMPRHPPEMPDYLVLRTEHGRAEVMLNACAVLHIDENSSIRLLANTLTYPQVELVSGTAVVELDGGK